MESQQTLKGGGNGPRKVSIVTVELDDAITGRSVTNLTVSLSRLFNFIESWSVECSTRSDVDILKLYIDECVELRQLAEVDRWINKTTEEYMSFTYEDKFIWGSH